MAFQLDPVDLATDRESVFQLWKRNLPALTEHRLDWFYKENPAGNSFTILARKEDEGVVGSGSYFIREMKIASETARVAVAADFSIDEKYRLFGPAMGIQRKLVEHRQGASDLSGGMAFPNKSGMGVFKRVGYSHLGDAEFWSKPISLKRFFARKMGDNPLTAMVSMVAGVALSVVDRFKRSRLPKGWKCTHVERFDGGFDLLWTEASPYYDVTPLRSSSFLNWRYVDNPVDDYFILCLKDNDGKVQGYVVYKEVAGYLEVVDVFSTRSKQAYGYLLQEMIAVARKKKKESVCLSFIGDDDFKDALKDKGFFFGKTVLRPLFVMFDDEALVDARRWFIFEGDMDL